MQWSHDAIILSLTPFGESGAIATVFTAERGICKGMCRYISSKKQRAIYQIGNRVSAHWRGRLEHQLGSFQCELIQSIAGHLIHDPLRLRLLTCNMHLIASLLAEQDPHPHLYHLLSELLSHLITCSDANQHLRNQVIFEYFLLQELGFGLDLSTCALSGQSHDLAYISPRSGRAATREAGEPYKEKLLALPAFLVDVAQNSANMSWESLKSVELDTIMQGLTLTGFFLERHAYNVKHVGLPASRTELAHYVALKHESTNEASTSQAAMPETVTS